jgi:hypothetical protein
MLERMRHAEPGGRPACLGLRIMIRKVRCISRYIFVIGLLSIATGNTAQPSECFPGPDFKPARGAGWHYQIDPATNQGCWHVKELGASSRRRTGEVVRSSRSTLASPSPSEGPASSSERRSDSSEGTPAAPSPQGSLKSWFSSKFTGLFNPPNAYSTEQSETATTGPSIASKRYNELSAPRQRQRTKSEQQTKVAVRKLDVQSEPARPQHLIAAASILEAAGDKPVLAPTALWGEDLKKAIEAVGEKDVVIAPAELDEDWQKALYEEFLRWRVKQLMPK